MAVISNLSVSLTANTRGLSKGLTKAKRQVKSFVGSVVSLKGGIIGALGIGGIGAALTTSLNAWRTQEQAMASLEAANNSMGRSTVGMTESMFKLAAQLQREGIIGDEAIIQGQSFLSTFSQIPDELMPRATRAMVDLMAKTGRTGSAAANMIGKAAMGQSGALKIAGITLSDMTLNAIKADNAMKKMAQGAGVNLRGLTDNGKTFKLILADIESQIGGTNKALAKTDTGAFDQLANSLGDLKEIAGKVVASGLGKWARQLSEDIDNNKISVDGLALSFKKWSVETLLSVAPVVESFKGIKLVIKSLKIAFMGFGALVTGMAANVATQLSSLGNIFGLSVSKGLADDLNNSYNEQLKNIAKLKIEAGNLAGSIADQTFSNNLKARLKEFEARATALDKKIKSPPPITEPKPQGRLEVLTPGGGSMDMKALFGNNPQIDETNKILNQMLNNPRIAVAG